MIWETVDNDECNYEVAFFECVDDYDDHDHDYIDDDDDDEEEEEHLELAEISKLNKI